MQTDVIEWCAQGLCALVYLDDGIVAIAGKQNTERASQKVKEVLGMVDNTVKYS